MKVKRCRCGCPVIILPGDAPRKSCVRCATEPRVREQPKRWVRADMDDAMARLMGAARGE